jgi:hypothetical protein
MRHLISLGWNGTFQAPVARRAPVVTRLSLSPVHDGDKRAPSAPTEHFVRETQLGLQTCPAARTPGSRSNDKRRRLPPRRAVASMPALLLRPASLPGSDSGPLLSDVRAQVHMPPFGPPRPSTTSHRLRRLQLDLGPAAAWYPHRDGGLPHGTAQRGKGVMQQAKRRDLAVQNELLRGCCVANQPRLRRSRDTKLHS